jgi:hypothetical protein
MPNPLRRQKHVFAPALLLAIGLSMAGSASSLQSALTTSRRGRRRRGGCGGRAARGGVRGVFRPAWRPRGAGACVLGVLPRGFHGLIGRTDVWIPLGTSGWIDGDTGPERPWSRGFELFGRVRAGLTIDAADARYASEGRAAIESTGAADRILGPSGRLRLVPLATARVSPLVVQTSRVLAWASGAVLLFVLVTIASLALLCRQRLELRAGSGTVPSVQRHARRRPRPGTRRAGAHPHYVRHGVAFRDAWSHAGARPGHHARGSHRHAQGRRDQRTTGCATLARSRSDRPHARDLHRERVARRRASSSAP